MSEDLAQLRRHLDQVDARLIEALADRQRLIRQTARIKAVSEADVRDRPREKQLLGRLADRGEGLGLDRRLVTAVFREILDHSVRCQGDHLVHGTDPILDSALPIEVAFQGTDGAYSHQAAIHHFGSRERPHHYRGYGSFREMLAAVEQGRCAYAMLPIENTTAGSINEAYDQLAQSSLSIVGEEALKVEHCLLACEPVAPETLRQVASHPQALTQCSELIDSLGCEALAVFDTAGAARQVAEDGDRTLGALASATAADLYGLCILRRNVANQRTNTTRFFVVGRSAVDVDRRVPAKTSLLFRLCNRPGGLAHALTALASRGLDLTKLESRPVLDAPWESLFYADVVGHLTDPRMIAALEEMAGLTTQLRVLGCYPARVAMRDGP